VRAQWEGLHAALVSSVGSRPAETQFQVLRGSKPALSRFDSAEGLLAYLAAVDGDLDEKDQIYAALVRAVQVRARWSKLATALIWCGLWPGLDRIYRRQAATFRRAPDELVQEISLAFSKLLSGLDLARVRRVAATLVRSTERELLAERRRQRAEERRRAEPEASVADDESETVDLAAAAGGQPAAPTPGPSFPGEIAALRARLGPMTGADTDLLLAVVVLGADQREVAAQLGLSYEAARKRFQRAVAGLRRELRVAGAKPDSRPPGIAQRHRRERGPGSPGGCGPKPVRSFPPHDDGGRVPELIQPELIPSETVPSDTVGINARCLLRTRDGRRVVLAAGVPIAHYAVGDAMAEAYAMVQLVTQGLADQREVARAFRCSVRSVRRYQRRFEEGGLAALGRPDGYPAGRPRLDPGRDRRVGALRAQGKSHREIAAVIGVSEKAIRKQVRRLGRSAADPNLSGSAPLEPGWATRPAAEPSLSESATVTEPGAAPEPAAEPNLSGSARPELGAPPVPAPAAEPVTSSRAGCGPKPARIGRGHR